MPADHSHLDTTPLTAPQTPEAVRSYRDAVRGGRSTLPPIRLAEANPAFAVGGGVGLLSLAFVLGLVGNSLLGLPASATFVLIVAGMIGVVVLLVALRVRASRPWRRWASLAAFASTNGLTFTPYTEGSTERGSIFDVGTHQCTFDRMRLPDSLIGHRAEVASLRYTTEEGEGDSRRTETHWWTYLVIGLDRNLPHMVLDAKANDAGFLGLRASDLPQAFGRKQTLHLEGDFDRYFRLSVPEGYERDALEVFTPDLMALLIDEAGGATGLVFDVEIVDDLLYCYASGRLDLAAPAVWQRLWSIVTTVGALAVRQTARYADDRVGERDRNVVAPAGRRLRVPSPVLGVAALVLIAALWVITQALVH